MVMVFVSRVSPLLLLVVSQATRTDCILGSLAGTNHRRHLHVHGLETCKNTDDETRHVVITVARDVHEPPHGL